MGDLNKIRLYPIDYNQIVRTQDVNEIDLEADPFLPNGWLPNPDSTVLGGGDAGKGVGGSGGEFGTPDETSGNK